MELNNKMEQTKLEMVVKGVQTFKFPKLHITPYGLWSKMTLEFQWYKKSQGCELLL